MPPIRKRGTDGFTLIELLIVIIILGLLAAIVVFAIGQTRGDAINATCKSTVAHISLAAEAVKNHEGAYGAAADLADSTKGGLMKDAPPVDNGNFTVTYAKTATGYTITTANDAGKTALATPGAYKDNDASSVLTAVCKGA